MDERTALLLLGVLTLSGTLVVLVLQWVRMRREDRDSGSDSDRD